uniref:HECT-type E3 ubiquitin transferase n=1 Tax=Arundo donax TaxID=35708 RepID=A0A0A9EYB5_ARUDO
MREFCWTILSHKYLCRNFWGAIVFLDELSTLDPELYRNLMQLKHYDGDVEDLCLDFAVAEELGGKRIVHELRPNGKNISVTNENKLHYVHAIADFKLNRQIVHLQMHFVEDSAISFHHLG